MAEHKGKAISNDIDAGKAFKVSVILACHNVEDFIADALDSIVAQSQFRDFEVIPVDDGSTDGTWDVIQRYEREYPENFFPIRFAVASGGPGKPRNVGLDRARAEYVIFMDPDDRIYKDGYSLLCEAMERYQSDVVIAARYGVPERQGPEARVWVDWIAPEPYINADSYAIKFNLLAQRPVILKTIYRRSNIEAWNLRFLEGVSSSEDEIFDMKYLLLSRKITKINDVVYLYTVARTGSITSKIRLKVFEDLQVLIPGLHDALSVYFNQTVVSSRIAGLLRTFYLPKLLLLADATYSAALDEARKACEAYGWDRLLLATNPVDRKIVRLLRDRKDTQLVLIFKRLALIRRLPAVRFAVNSATKAKRLTLRYGSRALSVAKTAARLAPDAVAKDGPVKIWASMVARTISGEPNGYWLFGDRRDKAGDNGEALYRYVRDKALHDKIAFVLSRDSSDWDRLAADGFSLIEYDSLEEWRMLYNCEHFFTSHVDNVIIQPWTKFGAPRGTPRYKLNFLQHGIIRSDLSEWLGMKEYNIFCTSSRSEYERILSNPGYHMSPDILKLTGLARHDLLNERDGDYVLVCPTWRSFLLDVSDEEFAASGFYRNWSALIYNARLQEVLAEAGLHLKVMLHSSISAYTHLLEPTDHVEIVRFGDVQDFSSLLSGARMMITDYSTISFDVAYLRRPVLYFNFAEQRTHSTGLAPDLELYSKIGYREETVDGAVSVVNELARSGFALDRARVAAIDDFFAFPNDRQNRERILNAVLAKDAAHKELFPTTA